MMIVNNFSITRASTKAIWAPATGGTLAFNFLTNPPFFDPSKTCEITPRETCVLELLSCGAQPL
jgi:hypothetical protein